MNTFPVFFPEDEYPGYQTNYDHTYQDLAAYNQGYDQSSLSSSPYVSLNEKQDELDMDVSDLTKYMYFELKIKPRPS